MSVFGRDSHGRQDNPTGQRSVQPPTGNRDSLEDAYEGLLTMLGVIEELRARA